MFLGMVVHAWDPSYSGGGSLFKAARAKVNQNLSQKQASVVTHTCNSSYMTRYR
jgi:hypothetical protein